FLVRYRNSELAPSCRVFVYKGDAIERGTPHERDDKGGVALLQRAANGVVVQGKNVFLRLAFQCHWRVSASRHDALDRVRLSNVSRVVRRCADRGCSAHY